MISLVDFISLENSKTRPLFRCTHLLCSCAAKIHYYFRPAYGFLSWTARLFVRRQVAFARIVWQPAVPLVHNTKTMYNVNVSFPIGSSQQIFVYSGVPRKTGKSHVGYPRFAAFKRCKS